MNLAWRAPAAAPPLTPPVVPRLLRSHGAAAMAMVDHYLDGQPASPYLADLIADYPRRGGKMMRPAMCIAAARAHGATTEAAVRSAAAIELLHNGLLIHDDIEDGSEIRRGRPTLHALHGIPLAVNAGDAMLLLALRPLLDNARPLGERVTQRILDSTLRMARETAEGQALELGWRDRNITDLREADYLTMVLKKTAWMSTIWPLQVGQLIGTQGWGDTDRVVRFGFFLGAAFQIQDDLLNLVADAAYGKEACGDLYEGKRTLMLICARERADPAGRAFIDRVMGLPRAARTPAMIADLHGLMQQLGAIDHGRAVASAMAGAAAHEFDAAFGHLPGGDDRDFLAGLVPWVFERG